MPNRRIDLTVSGLDVLRRRRSEKWSVGPDVLASTIAEMDFPLAEAVTDRLIDAVRRGDLGYRPLDTRPVAESLAGFAGRRLGWTVDPDQVWLTADVMSGLIELTRMLVPAGASAGFFTPAYPPFFADLSLATGNVMQIPLLAGGGADLPALELALRRGLRVLIVTNPHNPTGWVYPAGELAAIAEMCQRYDAWVLSDEIHAPLTLPGASFVPFLEVSAAARARGFALTSASKAFNVAGLKCAMIVTADPGPREVVRRMPAGLADRVGILGVMAAEAAFTLGDAWLDAVVAQLDRNRALLAELIASTLPGVSWRPPAATYLAWLDCTALGLDDPATTFLDVGRVALSPGRAYGPGWNRFVRLNFGTSAELVAETVRRMAVAITEFRKTPSGL